MTLATIWSPLSFPKVPSPFTPASFPSLSSSPPMQASHSYVAPSSYAANVVGFSHPCAYQYQSDDPHTTSLHSTQPYSTDSLFKKRKIDRACDACRRRKIKCDGPRTENNVCTNCTQYGKLCSYVSVRSNLALPLCSNPPFTARLPNHGVPPKRALFRLAIIRVVNIDFTRS